MKLYFKHAATSHSVFIGHPHNSVVCGVIKKEANNYWEWQVRCRNGIFDTKTNQYRPSLIRSGYSSKRENALRNLIDYLKSLDWSIYV